jgi:sterol desaturase/sphingolipid hydroxylase (fatty acid hydroxylase superfamily)
MLLQHKKRRLHKIMGTIIYYTTSILVLVALLLTWLERKFPYRKGLPVFRPGYWIDFFWYTLIQSYLLKILIFDYIILPADKRWHMPGNFSVGSWPVVLQVLFFLVLHDFYIYWFHRLQHHSKILWRIHEAHHSNKEVDWLAGSRSHSAEIIINQTIEFAPIVLLGANPAVLPVKALLDAVWGMFIHSNINIKMGRLQYVINGPEMHLWHHANHKEVFYANYATKFAIWDWLFGTAYLPAEKPVDYGLYYRFPKDYFLQHVFAFKRLDEEQFLKNKTFKKYHQSRQAIIHWMKQKIFSKL